MLKQAKQSLSPVAKFFVKQGKKVLAAAQNKVAPLVNFIQNHIPEKPALTGEFTYKLAMGKNSEGHTLYFAGGVSDGKLVVTDDITQAVELHAEVIKKTIGGEVEARVIKVDTEERRIGLSIKAVSEDFSEADLKAAEEEYTAALKPGEDMVNVGEVFADLDKLN